MGKIFKALHLRLYIMKSKKTGVFALSAIVAVLAVASMASIPESNAANTKMYEVTVTNLTPGQPITAPLLVTHSADAGFYSVGEEASDMLQQLAENGNATPLVEMLQAHPGVLEIVRGEAHLVPANDPGATGLSYSETFMVTSEGNMRYLSFASMLVCTNDGFAGVDTVRLPINQKTVYAKAYDARTEMNTEDFADLVPPCQGETGVTSDDAGTGASSDSTAEDGIVIPHPGIMGGNDLLESVHAWSNPVVKIDIVRMR